MSVNRVSSEYLNYLTNEPRVDSFQDPMKGFRTNRDPSLFTIPEVDESPPPSPPPVKMPLPADTKDTTHRVGVRSIRHNESSN